MTDSVFSEWVGFQDEEDCLELKLLVCILAYDMFSEL